MPPTNWRIPTDIAEYLDRVVPRDYPSVSRAIDELVRKGLARAKREADVYTHTFIELFHDPSLDATTRSSSRDEVIGGPGAIHTIWKSSHLAPGLPFRRVFELMGLAWSPAPGTETHPGAVVTDLHIEGITSDKDSKNFLFPERLMGKPWPNSDGEELPIEPEPLRFLTPNHNRGPGFFPLEAPMLADRSGRKHRQLIPAHDTLGAHVRYEGSQGFPQGRLFAAIRRVRPEEERI